MEKLDDNGVGDAFVSQVDRRKRPLKLIGIGLLGVIAVTALAFSIWQGVRYQQRKTMRAPAKQAQVFEQVSATARQHSDLWQYDKEIGALEDYLATDPIDEYRSKALLDLGQAYIDNKQYDEAVKRYQQVEKDPANQLDAWRGLGKAYLGMGDRVKAKEYFQKVVDAMKLKTDPESIFRLTTDEAQLNSLDGA